MRTLVVGASMGIGKDIADNLPGTVYRISRNGLGPEGLCFQADVRNAMDIKDVANQIEASSPACALDGLIYCAGTQGRIGPALDMLPSEWEEVIDTNLNGFFNCLWAFKHLLFNASSPKVIALSGGGAVQARPNFAPYGCSKTALLRFIETLAAEYPKCRFHALAPGAIATRMQDEVIKAGPRLAGAKECRDAANAQKFPEEAIKAVKFLLSENGKGFSGRLVAAKWDKYEEEGFYLGDIGLLRRVNPPKDAS